MIQSVFMNHRNAIPASLVDDISNEHEYQNQVNIALRMCSAILLNTDDAEGAATASVAGFSARCGLGPFSVTQSVQYLH
jgi:hypothetical protein